MQKLEKFILEKEKINFPHYIALLEENIDQRRFQKCMDKFLINLRKFITEDKLKFFSQPITLEKVFKHFDYRNSIVCYLSGKGFFRKFMENELLHLLYNIFLEE